MDPGTAKEGTPGTRQPGGAVAAVQLVLIVAAGATAAATLGWDRWRPLQLAVIVALTVAGDVLSVEVGPKFRVSGTGLGLMLAIVLQGPGPAAVVALFALAAGWLPSREPLPALRNNVVNYCWAALASGICFHVATSAVGAGSDRIAFYLFAFLTYSVMTLVSFLVAASYDCYIHRVSLLRAAREAVAPLLSAHLFSAMLTMGGIYVALTAGTIGIALAGLTLGVFQYLIGELLKSKRRGQDLHRLATIDTLTGLANRERFQTELAEVIARVEPLGLTFAVMLIDLDRFKEINDTLGHHYGDELLRKLGPRLEAAVGPDGLVARLGGDEFALLTPPIREEHAFEALAGRLIACVQEAIYVDELALEVGASIGIARFPADGGDANTLLRCADVAMYAAKETHTGWKYYAAELDRNSVRKLSVLSDFRRALEQDEIVVYYQPIVDVVGTRVRGAEALVRWDHPTLGLLAPGAFVETVEQTGLIGPMTRQVLERAVHQCVQWREAGRELNVAVNLSVRNLLDRSLPWEIDRLLTTYGLPPDALQLEITESMLMSDPERVLATVTRLNALGVRLSVDDFGTGYSSLANLRNMPIDELKIDRSFVSPMLRDESDLIIVRSTINLGHDLGLRVIAEGVEDEETLARLGRLGCDLAQGYHVSRPMPPEQFIRWLDQTRPGLAVAI